MKLSAAEDKFLSKMEEVCYNERIVSNTAGLEMGVRSGRQK